MKENMDTSKKGFKKSTRSFGYAFAKDTSTGPDMNCCLSFRVDYI
jgi:hypothetical protein